MKKRVFDWIVRNRKATRILVLGIPSVLIEVIDENLKMVKSLKGIT